MERVGRGGTWGARSLGKWEEIRGEGLTQEMVWRTSRVVLLSWFSRWLIVPKKLCEISFLGVHPTPWAWLSMGSFGGFTPAKFYGDGIVL